MGRKGKNGQQEELIFGKEKNRMNGRYLTPQERERILAKIKVDSIPENGQELLGLSRQLGEIKDSKTLAEKLPFRMFCETQYGKKEGYQDIVRQFREIKDSDYDRMFHGTCQGKKAESLELAYFLAACADTLEVTSKEIYEHYRYLADIMKRAVCDLRRNGFFLEDSMKKIDKETASLLGAAILKGCEMKILLREKYETIGKTLVALACSGMKES